METEEKKRGKIHYAWVIFGGCCILTFSALGLIMNTVGVFYVPICNDLGFSIGAFTLHKTIFGFALAATVPLVGKAFDKYDIRITMSIAILVFGGCGILMGFLNTLWQWYIVAAIQGMAGSFFIYIPIPVILTNWFQTKSAPMIGFASAFSGIAGIIMNPVGSLLIERSGWRAGMITFSVICIVCSLPITSLVLRLKPEDKGLKAYSFGKNEMNPIENADTEVSYTLSQAKNSVSFYVAVLASVSIGLVVGTASALLPPYGTSLGFSATVAAALGSCAMAGNMLSKLVIGNINDRFGTKNTLMLSGSVAAFGFLLLTIGKMPLTHIGAFFTGPTMMMNAVIVAYMTRALFGTKQYGRIFPFISLATTLPANAVIPLYGWIYDKTGSYFIVMAIGVLSMALFVVLIPILFRINASEKQKILSQIPQ